MTAHAETLVDLRLAPEFPVFAAAGPLRKTLRVFALAALPMFAGQIALGADFDGDGNDDLLLRHLHSDAWRYYTLVDDVPVENEIALDTEPVWRFVATGDFDGNGYDDVLVRRIDTLESAHQAVTANGVEVRPLNLTVNPLYDILGAGDVDGDGKDEIVIRRNADYGLWLYYDVDGTRATLRRDLGLTQNLDWTFRGIGDMNGDGREDILVRHDPSKHWIVYLMNGASRAVLRRPAVTRNPLFVFQALADITGDGKADPVLRSTRTGEWIYYATARRRGTTPFINMRLYRGLGMPRDRAWAIASIGDYDGDSRATPVLRHPHTGDWRLHDIDGATSDEVRFPGLTTTLSWAAAETLPQDNPAQLSRVEFLQGPPVFRKDYRTGTTIGPINASRPENAGDAIEPWDVYKGWSGWGPRVWSGDNQGFVTSVWGRRTVVAVEATHPFSHPLPEIVAGLVSQDGGEEALDVLLEATEPSAEGYRTEAVFNLPAEKNQPGGSVTARLVVQGEVMEERITLFGETVEQFSVTWVPISTPNFGPPDLGESAYMNETLPYLPIGRYRSRIAETFAYQPTGNEQGEEFNFEDLWSQFRLHHTTHACGPGDRYFGIFNETDIREAGTLPEQPGRGGVLGVLISYNWNPLPGPTTPASTLTSCPR